MKFHFTYFDMAKTKYVFLHWYHFIINLYTISILHVCYGRKMLQIVLISKKSNLDIMLSFYDTYDDKIVISLKIITAESRYVNMHFLLIGESLWGYHGQALMRESISHICIVAVATLPAHFRLCRPRSVPEMERRLYMAIFLVDWVKTNKTNYIVQNIDSA